MRNNHWSLLGIMLFLFFSWLAPAHAAWVPAGMSGQEVLSLVEDPTTATTWYAGTASGGLYKNTGTSGVWVASNAGLPAGMGIRALALDSSNPNNVYAGLDGGGVYKTVNGGSNWSPTGLDGLSVMELAIDPYNSAILYAATNNGVYKSTDWGTSWLVISSGAFSSSDVRKIAIPPADPALSPLPAQTDIIYAATVDGLYKSIDSGTTWERSGLASQIVNTVVIDPQQPNTLYAGTAAAGIFKSGDGGATWAQINNGLGSLNVLSIAINQVNPNSLLAGTADGGIYRSDWWGDSWYAFNEGNSSLKGNTIKLLSPQPTYIFAGSGDGAISFDNSKSDMVLTSVNATPTAVKTGEIVTVTAVVKNQGQWQARDSYVRLYLSSDATINGSDPTMVDVWMPALAAGESKTITGTFAVPVMTNGTYYVGGYADAYNWIEESNETNNALAGNQITTTRLYADMVLTSVNATPTAVKTGEIVTVTAVVKNQGQWQARDSYVRLYLSSDATINGSDPTMVDVWMPALAAGESKTITGTFAVPVMTNGTYYVGGYADTYNWIEESNETNNALAGNQIGIGLVTPIANAGPDQTIECPITTEVSVALDGSHSYDPNGDPLTYTWSWGGGTASGVKPMITLPSGRTTITLTVNDGNGHTASDAVVVTVGDTIPPVTSASLIGVLGEDGWYKSDVTVILQAADACSHVKEVHYIVDNGEETVVTADSKSFSTNFVVSQEGEHTVTYWSVDNTGNGGTRITTQPINKHYTPPPPGGRGTGGSPGDGSSSAYYPSCVYVTLQVTEGVSQYSTDNGATWQPYTGAFAICDTTTVLYDNVEAPKTITINIDKTPPTITAIIYPPPNENGWYNTDVIVTFACTDDASGVAICPDPITVTTEGAGQTVSGTAYDFAGNSATTSVIINIDKTLPTITATVTPQPDANGWNSTDVTVSFTCSDNLSAFTPCPSPVTVTTEGAGQVITGTVTDQAGNIATASVTVNIDKSAPTISASINPVPNEAGWNNTDVTVSFDCADSGAGIAACTSPVTVTMEGQDQIITGRAIDKVGKTAEVPVTLNIDKTPPVITISGVEDGAVYTPCNVPVPSYSVTDSSSRVSSQNSTLTGGNANGTGAFIYTVTASDNAGNIITRSVYYKVEYSFGGFEAPVTLLKPFKQGSTVPVKLTIADGCENSISTAIVTLTLQLYSGETPVGDPIDATSNVPDSGNLFRYTDGHYIYNLSTGNLQSGSYVVSVTLDDGSTKTITLQIKP